MLRVTAASEYIRCVTSATQASAPVLQHAVRVATCCPCCNMLSVLQHVVLAASAQRPRHATRKQMVVRIMLASDASLAKALLARTTRCSRSLRPPRVESQGRAGQGRAGQGRAGQGRAGRAVWERTAYTGVTGYTFARATNQPSCRRRGRTKVRTTLSAHGPAHTVRAHKTCRPNETYTPTRKRRRERARGARSYSELL
jgi:hypothetical protein